MPKKEINFNYINELYLLLDNKKYEELKKELDFIVLEENDIEITKIKAKLLFSTWEINKSLELFLKVNKEFESKDWDVLLMIWIINFNLEKYNEAEKYFKDVISIKNDSSIAIDYLDKIREKQELSYNFINNNENHKIEESLNNQEHSKILKEIEDEANVLWDNEIDKEFLLKEIENEINSNK